MNKVWSAIAASCLVLAACSAGEPVAPVPKKADTSEVEALAPEPLASDAEITAAETAPVLPAMNPFAPPHEPFRVIGNVWHVGGGSVSAYLITTPEGHFLIDGILPQSPPMILDNIAKLGFDIADVKYLLNSHAHIDHAGGLARLKQRSGAIMVASEKDKPILETGVISFGPTRTMPFPPVKVDQVIEDGESLTLGGVTMTAMVTPGHSPGCTSWLLHVPVESGETYKTFFHCSSSLGGQTIAPESYPGMLADYRETFRRIGELEADVFLAFHAGMFGMDDKYQRMLAGDELAFVGPNELQVFNAASEAQFKKALAEQQSALEDGAN